MQGDMVAFCKLCYSATEPRAVLTVVCSSLPLSLRLFGSCSQLFGRSWRSCQQASILLTARQHVRKAVCVACVLSRQQMVSDHACLVDVCCIVLEWLELYRHPHALQDSADLWHSPSIAGENADPPSCLQGQRPKAACESESVTAAKTGCAEAITMIAVIIMPP